MKRTKLTAITPEMAEMIRQKIKGAYFGNPHRYGDVMGYHVGGLEMICLHVPKSANPEWVELGYNWVEAEMNRLIAPLNFPIKAYSPEFFGEWQVYFTII